jgi:hypothetical protein
MNKSELVDRIRHLNPTASTDFLDAFTVEDLISYLRQLQEIRRDRSRHTDGHESDSLLVAN